MLWSAPPADFLGQRLNEDQAVDEGGVIRTDPFMVQASSLTPRRLEAPPLPGRLSFALHIGALCSTKRERYIAQ